jgi:hypothetical protein
LFNISRKWKHSRKLWIRLSSEWRKIKYFTNNLGEYSRDNSTKRKNSLNLCNKAFSMRMKKFISFLPIWKMWKISFWKTKSLEIVNCKITVKSYKIFTKNRYLFRRERKEQKNFNRLSRMTFSKQRTSKWEISV